MLIRNKILALLSTFISANLALPSDIYIIKLAKGPLKQISRSENSLLQELLLRLRPFQSKTEESDDAKDYSYKEKKFSCRPGQVCIGKVQHNENSVVINSGLRNRGPIPFKYYGNYPNLLEDTTDTDEYMDYDVPMTFSDLTRLENNKKGKQSKRRDTASQQKVSTDYLDLNDFLRAFDRKKKLQMYRKANTLVESQGGEYPRAYSSDSGDSSEDENFKVEDSSEKYGRKKRVPKRFEIVKNGKKKKKYEPTDESEVSRSRSSEENEETEFEEYETTTTKRPKKKKLKKKKIPEPLIPDKKEMYVQRPGVFIKVGPESDENNYRKRLEHFLPKRYHWDEDDFQKLGYYWFNGPQGKYPGSWRISY